VHDREDTGFRGRPLGVLGAAFASALGRRSVREADPERREVVHTDDRSRGVLDCAHRLAAAGREDDAAVAEIRKAAKAKQRTLDDALRASRFAGHHLEERQANLVFRLLHAARGDGHISPPSDSDERRIRTVEAFTSTPLADQWELLVEREPRLAEIEKDVKAGRFGPLRAHPGGDRKLLAETARGSIELDRRLRDLLGPSSAQQDTLMLTGQARESARTYLADPARPSRTAALPEPATHPPRKRAKS
jgi:hypothetical protein